MDLNLARRVLCAEAAHHNLDGNPWGRPRAVSMPVIYEHHGIETKTPWKLWGQLLWRYKWAKLEKQLRDLPTNMTVSEFDHLLMLHLDSLMRDEARIRVDRAASEGSGRARGPSS